MVHNSRSSYCYFRKSILELHPGQSIVIDKGKKHRVQNFGHEVLEIIEIQTGTYFGEDDIVRFEDKYEEKIFTESPYSIPVSEDEIKEFIKEIPQSPGIYKLDKFKSPLYIGGAKALNKR